MMSNQGMSRSSIGQYVAILPHLTTLVLIFCTSSLVRIIAEGHFEDVPEDIELQILLSFVAFTAPPSVYLCHRLGYGCPLLTGACITALGFMLPPFFVQPTMKVGIFAAFHGMGLSMMFQASSLAVMSVMQRCKILYSVFTLCLATAAMASTKQFIDLIVVKVSDYLPLVLTGLLFCGSVCPAVLLLLANKSDQKIVKDQSDDMMTLIAVNDEVKSSQVVVEEKNENLQAISCQTVEEKGGSSYTTQTALSQNILNKIYVLLWWAVGINLTLYPSNLNFWVTKGMLLTFALSFITLTKKLLYGNNPVSSVPHYMMGLLGVNGLLTVSNVVYSDKLHHYFLFTMGFLLQTNHQRKPSDCPRAAESFTLVKADLTKVGHSPGPDACQICIHCADSLCNVINEVCVEYIFSFGAMLIGLLMAYPVGFVMEESQFVSSLTVPIEGQMIMSMTAVLVSLLGLFEASNRINSA